MTEKRIVSGIALHLDEPNQNGDIFPASVVIQAIKEAKTRIDEKMMLGQFGFLNDGRSISPMDVTHVVDSLEVIDRNLVCQIELLETPKGKVVMELLQSGHARLGVSGRGEYEIVDGVRTIKDFSISSVSIVPEPDIRKPISCSWMKPSLWERFWIWVKSLFTRKR